MIRVLIADDSAMFRRGLCRLLEADGRFVVVAEAADGQEAVRAAARTRPDLVLMDIRMPGQDGLSTARILHARQAAMPIVILTELDTSRHRAEAQAAGCLGYISKSQPVDALVVTIAMLLEQFTARQALIS